ncbi:hypothetical protein ACWDLG_01425 [Nonomuraea sp. NPDC003727]
MAGDTVLDRVVEIFNGEGEFRGSGYVIAPDLVLTCAHLFEDARDGERGFVRLAGIDRPLGIGRFEQHSCYVRDDDGTYDIALAVLESAVRPDIWNARIAKLRKNADQVRYDAIGFPDYGVEEDGSGRRQFFGTIALGSFADPYRLELTVDSGRPELRAIIDKVRGVKPLEKPWAGVSGAAVLADGKGVVVGVCTGHLSPSLRAVSIAHLGEDPSLRSLLEPRGIRLEEYTGQTPSSDLRELVPHDNVVTELANSGSCLCEKRIPFARPEHHHPARPENLLARLEFESPGVLLTGAAGAGKSRICLETAALAQRNGWQVVHQRPATDPAIERAVDMAVRSGRGKLLIVLDDVRPDISFDPGAMREGAGHRLRRVAVLASAGPTTFATLRERRVAQRFAHAAVPDTEPYLRRVQEAILGGVGPQPGKASGWSAEELAGLCGLRPGLAVLIAAELKGRVAGEPAVPRRSRLPGGELSNWLLTHLSADELFPGPGVAAGREPYPLAAAAALAACPQPRPAVEAAVRRLLAGSPASGLEAVSVVDTLVGRGWLEEREGRLHGLHDLVTEELLRYCLVTPSGETLHGAQSAALLDAALTGTATFARFAHRLRLMSDGYPESALPPLLERLCGGWLDLHAREAGMLLRDDDNTQEGERGLLAMVAGPPWHAALTRNWSTVAGPCLQAAEAGQREPLVLTNLLDRCPEGLVPLPLVESALDWLRRFPGHTGAPKLLGVLVRRLEPGAAGAQSCLAQALEWLSENSTWSTASRVLDPLLRSTTLTDEEAGQVVAAALRWLDKHGEKPLGSFVLRPLLERRAPDGRLRVRSAERALAWLRHHDTRADAHFVLRALLAAPGIEARHFHQAVSHTLNWFAAHGQSNAAYQLADVLFELRDGLSATDAVLDWLDAHNTRLESLHLVKEVVRLKEKDISRAQARRAIAHALIWLEACSRPENQKVFDAKEVIHALAGRGRRKPSEDNPRVVDRMEFSSTQPDRIARYAADWMDSHGVERMSAQLVSSMLGFWHCGPEQGQRISAHALDWLDTHKNDRRYGAVLGELMRRGQLTDAQAGRAIDRAAQWLREAEHPPGETFYAGVLKLLKKRLPREPGRAEHSSALIDAVLAARHRDRRPPDDGSAPPPAPIRPPIGPSIPRPISPAPIRPPTPPSIRPPIRLSLDEACFLAGVPNLTEEQTAQVVPAVLDWLELHAEHQRSDFVLRSVLRWNGLRTPEARRVIDFAFSWLHRWNDAGQAKAVHDGPALVITGLLRRAELTGARLADAAALALEWMSSWFRRRSGLNPTLLGALLGRPELPPRLMADVLLRALHWRGKDIVLLGRVGGPRPEQDSEPDEPGWTLEEQAFAWLEANHARSEAGGVIGALMSRLLRAPHIDDVAVQRALGFALTWLEEYSEEFTSHHVLPVLLDHQERFAEHERRLLGLALRWLARHHAVFGALQVLRHCVDHPGLTPQERQESARYAFAWLREHGTKKRASFVLRPLAELDHLSQDQVRLLTDRILEWSSLMVDRLEDLNRKGQLRNPSVERPDPRYVLQRLLVRADLPPGQLARVAGAALDTRLLPGLQPAFDWELPGPASLPDFALDSIEPAAHLAEAGDAIASLLGARELKDHRPELISLSLRWLGEHSRRPEAVTVCTAVFRFLRPLADEHDAVTRFALDWLDAHPADARSAVLLQHLLGPSAAGTSAAAIRHAVVWLEAHAGEYAATFVLTPLLRRPERSPQDEAITIRQALDWLERHGLRPRSSYLLDSLLRHAGLTSAQRDQVIRHALGWVRAHQSRPSVSTVLISCLGCSALPADQLREICGAVLAWLGGHAGEAAVPDVVRALLSRDDLAHDQAVRVRQYADDWLAVHGLEPSAGSLLPAYLARSDLAQESVSALVGHGLAWLDEHVTNYAAHRVLGALLRQEHLGTGHARRAAALALTWADEHRGTPPVAVLRDLLLARDDLRADQRGRALALRAEPGEEFEGRGRR